MRLLLHILSVITSLMVVPDAESVRIPLRPAQIKQEIPVAKPLRFGKDTVSAIFIGDVMMHTRQMNHDMEKFLRGIRHELKDADIAVANMEFSLGGEPFTGYPAFSAPDRIADYVADCGVDVFLTANNHILDRNSSGLERTLGIYRPMKDSVLFTGTASGQEEDKKVNPLIISRKGIKIALINFTYGTNAAPSKKWPGVKGMDKTSIAEMICRAKDKGADYIIALPHWGYEYRLKHSEFQQQWAEWLINQGVDAIVGTHPHVVQDTTHIKGIPVIYSIGNAVSNMSAVNTRLELAVKFSFTRDLISGKTEMLEPELRFMWCTLPDMLTDSYCTIFVDEWIARRDEWLESSDYDNMIATYRRVLSETGIQLSESGR